MIMQNLFLDLSRFCPSRFSSPSRRVASSAFQKCWDLVWLDVCSSRYCVDIQGLKIFPCTGATKIAARFFLLTSREIEELADVLLY